MYRRGKGLGSGVDRRVEETECPSCACPHRPTDRKCMYCGTELNVGMAAFKIDFTPYISNLREFFNPVPASKSGLPVWKMVLSVLLSSFLLGIGVMFILKGLRDGGHFNWTVAALLIIYGIAALRNSYISTHK